MGVGKTAEGIGLDLDLRETYGQPGAHVRTLIICTKNGIDVWRRHLRAFGITDNRVLAIDPKNRAPFEKELANGAKKYDYYICHWDVLAKLEDINRPKHIIWDHVIADEAQLAKNRTSARTRELKKIKCHVKTALSGTPADDKPQDLWSILNWLYPKLYSSYWKFFNKYIEWNDYSGFRTITGVKNIDQLQSEIEPFYMRRTLHDVRDDMPEKIPTTIEVSLSAKQRKMYEEMQEFHIARLGEDEDELVAPIAIAVLQRLQQMALGTVELDWTEFDEGRALGPTVNICEPSSKLDAVFDIIEINEEESFVVFTNFKDVANMVEARCKARKIPVSKITGDITKSELRDQAVSDFQAGKTRVFVGTIGAAGTTITLNRAHTAIFVDRNWNPSKNEQAEDRIFRIDNDRDPIQIIDIVARDTVDESRNEKIGKKASWLKEMLTPRG